MLIINGPCPFIGEVDIQGSKNTAFQIIAAACLFRRKILIRNIPDISDMQDMFSLLGDLCIKIEKSDDGVYIDSSEAKIQIPSQIKYAKIRGSILLISIMLVLFGKSYVHTPGGCSTLGMRAINIHLGCMESLGAKIGCEFGVTTITADRLHGNEIILQKPSVTGAGNAILAACFADGDSIIYNAPLDPEITTLIDFINKSGGYIVGHNTLYIKGGMKPNNIIEYTIPFDRIEASSYLVAACYNGDVRIKSNEFIKDHITNVTDVLEKIGAKVEYFDNGVRVKGCEKISSTNIIALPHPGFPTDVQPIMTTLLSVADGISYAKDTIWPNRMNHVSVLRQMGGKARMLTSSDIEIEGVQELRSANSVATNIRESFALILASTIAQGTSTVTCMQHINRGYSNVLNKLKGLGVRVQSSLDYGLVAS